MRDECGYARLGHTTTEDGAAESKFPLRRVRRDCTSDVHGAVVQVVAAGGTEVFGPFERGGTRGLSLHLLAEQPQDHGRKTGAVFTLIANPEFPACDRSTGVPVVERAPVPLTAAAALPEALPSASPAFPYEK